MKQATKTKISKAEATPKLFQKNVFCKSFSFLFIFLYKCGRATKIYFNFESFAKIIKKKL